MRSIALRALARMYRPDVGLFSFCLRRREDGDALEGVSRRYTAIALIGLAGEEERVAVDVLGGQQPADVADRLLRSVHEVEDVGEVALALWAARALRHEASDLARQRLLDLRPAERSCPTVELAWALTALSIDSDSFDADSETAGRIAKRLLASFAYDSGLFPHWPVGAKPAALRGHVCCYADLVYPIQALAHYHARTSDNKAASVAKTCADRMCSLQGPQGQWWWHYDVRTGQVIERYPVYAIHQDAMGPMALLDLKDACGVDHSESIERSLDWLVDPSERDGSLIDPDTGVVWRKIARSEPWKLSRTVQALASRCHPSFRVPGINRWLPPGRVDWESRPYHFGWLLYAWSPRRCAL